MKREKLSETEIEAQLESLEGWSEKNGHLFKRFEFENFAKSLEFVNQLGEIAEKHDHHPDIMFGWGYAEVNLTTHDTGGITDFDFAVAKEASDI